MRALRLKIRSAIEHFKDSLTEAQWDGLRAVAVLAAVAVLGFGGYWVGVPLWRHWQNRSALAQADRFGQQKDYRSMLLALRRATELAPADFATWSAVERHLAEIGSPEALIADEQMSRLAPGNLSLRLAFVQDALHFGKYDAAETQLAKIDAAAPRDLAFHRLAAALDLALGRPADFTTQLKSIIAADPANANARFTYDALEVWSPDSAPAAAARADLDRLLADPAIRVRAAIELIVATAKGRDPYEFQRLMTRLLGVFSPGTPPDFSKPDPPAWEALLRGIQAAAVPVPTDAALVARWLADLGRSADALAWLASLPPSTRDAVVVLDIAAELDAEAGNIGALDGILRRGAWGPLPPEAVTLALAGHVQRLRYDVARGRATWGDAVSACGNSIPGLRALARLADIWREPDGAEQALHAVLSRAPDTVWAYQALRNDYLARHDLTDLWQLYDRWTRVLPDDRDVAAEWILVGCIIGQASPDAYARAAQLQQDNPGSRLACLADVAALWRQGQDDSAWSVLQTMPQSLRSQPQTAFWTALVAADLGRTTEVSVALTRAYRLDLSDPERSLLQAAARKAGLPAQQ
jgi:tetratricopeptide (TPR) repeat protein